MPMPKSSKLSLADLRERLEAIGGEAFVVDRLYPIFSLHSQATTRWSTVRPPLAQVPVDLLHLLVPDPDWPWFGWDWDQLHIRLAVGYTGDKLWTEALENHHDLHTLTACELFSIPLPPDRCDPHSSKACEDWRGQTGWQGKDDPRRSVAKRYIYRLLKGGDPYKEPTSIPGIEALGLDRKVIREAGVRWAHQHPAVVAWLDSLRKQCRTNGEVRDFCGARRRFSERSKHAERAACDFPTQAGEVRVLEQTILAVHDAFGDDVRFVYQRHDFVQWAISRCAFLTSVLESLAKIAQATVVIEGRSVYLPATFYLNTGGGKVVWKPLMLQ